MRIKNRELEQQIAVFGESGSGKTVLLSSFYGAAQERSFQESNHYSVTSENTRAGNRLQASYLGMKQDATVPQTNRQFDATSLAFTVRPTKGSEEGEDARSFDAVRLVWHDYPGDWFTDDTASPEEEKLKIDTFKSLLGSDVALVLIDGQKLLDYAGEEERYLKAALWNIQQSLRRLESQILEDGKRLVRFPRIWILALSKADLLPDLDVFDFRNLLIGKAADEIADLRDLLAEFVVSPEGLSVGEDFIRLSSAKFEPGKIEVTERIGLDLILPLATMLPFQRHLRWYDQKLISTKVAEQLLKGVPMLSALLLKLAKGGGPLAWAAALLGAKTVNSVLTTFSEMGADQLKTMNSEALEKKDFLSAILTHFALDLDAGETERVLMRSKK